MITKKFTKNLDIIFATFVLGIVAILLFPVPKFLLDVLLTFSITLSLIILIISLLIDTPLDISSFPTILLISAVLRLSLNIASTRLILSEGHQGPYAAGAIIHAFSQFVTSGNLVVGVIIFIILTIINFVVITKGAGRISEVAARFSLDAMPGKQMAIDADLAAGFIDEKVAKTRRKALEEESAFYGSMDGANKFVRGDAIAGLLITFINFVGGIIIGVLEKNLSFVNALQTYTILTVGDGLVSQIPGLVISLAAGLVVSKSVGSGSAEKAMLGQIGRYPKAIMVAGIVMLLIAAIPSMPKIPFLILSIIMLSLSFYINKNLLIKDSADVELVADPNSENTNTELTDENLAELMKLETIKIEVGYGLFEIISGEGGGKLTSQIKALRIQMAKNLGFLLPAVRIQDSSILDANNYNIYIKEIICGSGSLMPGHLMLINPTGGPINMPGIKTQEPAFGLNAMWVEKLNEDEAIEKGYTVIEPAVVIVTYLTEIIKSNITELLTYSQTQKILSQLGFEHKKLLDEISPNLINISSIQKILHFLLEENISIRDLGTIIEAIAEIIKLSNNILIIYSHVRFKLARQITNNYLVNNYLPVIYLSNDIETALITNFDDQTQAVTLPPTKLEKLCELINDMIEVAAKNGDIGIIIVPKQVRYFLYSLLKNYRSAVTILAHEEINNTKIKVKLLGTVEGIL